MLLVGAAAAGMILMISCEYQKGVSVVRMVELTEGCTAGGTAGLAMTGK